MTLAISALGRGEYPDVGHPGAAADCTFCRCWSSALLPMVAATLEVRLGCGMRRSKESSCGWGARPWLAQGCGSCRMCPELGRCRVELTAVLVPVIMIHAEPLSPRDEKEPAW
jgi:hypothetical protein